MNVRTTTARSTAIAIGLIVAILCLLAFWPATAQATPTRATDVATSAEGSYLLAVEGTFSTAGKDAVLARINKMRQEACKQGVPDPRDSSRKLTADDYVPMKWSQNLEKIAQTRAAEASIYQGHTRTNGTSCFTAYENDEITSSAENLAWGDPNMLSGIEMWYDEKSDWVKQSDSAVTGHYTSLINPNLTYIGVGSFTPSLGGWTCTAAEFLNASWYFADEPSEAETGEYGKYRQRVEVPASSITGLALQGKDTFKGASSAKFSAFVAVSLPNVYGGYSTSYLSPTQAVSWSSSNTSVATVSAEGKVSVSKCGIAKITASCPELGKKASGKIKVIPAATSVKKLTAKKKSLKVTWKKNASLATGYQIRYSLKSSMKGAKTITVKGAGKSSKTIKGLKAKKKYYVQVRSIAKVGGKTYTSAWSAKKSKKAK